MEKRQVDYAALGLKALRRAARKVAEDAIKNNLEIPIWRDGRVEYVPPESLMRGNSSVHRETAKDSQEMNND